MHVTFRKKNQFIIYLPYLIHKTIFLTITTKTWVPDLEICPCWPVTLMSMQRSECSWWSALALTPARCQQTPSGGWWGTPVNTQSRFISLTILSNKAQTQSIVSIIIKFFWALLAARKKFSSCKTSILNEAKSMLNKMLKFLIRTTWDTEVTGTHIPMSSTVSWRNSVLRVEGDLTAGILSITCLVAFNTWTERSSQEILYVHVYLTFYKLCLWQIKEKKMSHDQLKNIPPKYRPYSIYQVCFYFVLVYHTS